jgi:hypothetical protein
MTKDVHFSHPCFYLIHYVIDQSNISNSEMKKTFGGEAKQNPPDSTYSPMYINLFNIFQQKLNNLIKITSGHCRH